MKKPVKILILITAVTMMLHLFGCQKHSPFDIETYQNTEKGTMLLDYC